MSFPDPVAPPTVAERIIHSRGAQPTKGVQAMSDTTQAYEAFVLTPGFPRMGFTLGVYVRDDEGLHVVSHGILFHDLKKPKWRVKGKHEFVTFTHAGEAYTLRGSSLYPLYMALMECTLQEALEYEPTVFSNLPPDAPMINRVEVTDIAQHNTAG